MYVCVYMHCCICVWQVAGALPGLLLHFTWRAEAVPVANGPAPPRILTPAQPVSSPALTVDIPYVQYAAGYNFTVNVSQGTEREAIPMREGETVLLWV